MKIKVYSNNLEDTKEIAHIISKYVFKGMVITLNGDLGAGKTTFTKAFGKEIGIKEEINSPTFNILKCYMNNNVPLYHIDAYRLEDVNPDNLNIGLEEVIEGDGVCLIEWSIYIPDFIPSNSLNIEIKDLGDLKREFNIESNNPKFNDLMKELEGK